MQLPHTLGLHKYTTSHMTEEHYWLHHKVILKSDTIKLHYTVVLHSCPMSKTTQLHTGYTTQLQITIYSYTSSYITQ